MIPHCIAYRYTPIVLTAQLINSPGFMNIINKSWRAACTVLKGENGNRKQLDGGTLDNIRLPVGNGSGCVGVSSWGTWIYLSKIRLQ